MLCITLVMMFVIVKFQFNVALHQLLHRVGSSGSGVPSTVVGFSINVAWRQLPHLAGMTCSGRSIYNCLMILVIVEVLFTVSWLGASCKLSYYGTHVFCYMLYSC